MQFFRNRIITGLVSLVLTGSALAGTHEIKKGDTLWDIARLYDGVSVEQIKQLNNIHNSKRLKPGQKIKVAVKS